MKESELFEPVKQYFIERGYAVDAEVKHCDVVAVKDDELAVAELKTAFNIKLLTQATQRQQITSQVYVAVPAPQRETRHWRAAAHIVKRLGLGLLVVAVSPLGSWAYLKHAPGHQGKVTPRLRDAVLKEFAGRTSRTNTGGVTGTSVVTAYRETALCIAAMLAAHGPLPPREAAKLCGAKTQSILAKNHYGWFVRVRRGIYDLTEAGQAALAEYPDIHNRAKRLIEAHANSADTA